MKTPTTIEIIQKQGLEGLGLYYSVYKGVVTQRSEPEDVNRGKIEVYIPGIQGGLKVWALPCSWVGNYQYGAKFLTPKLGETVFLTFERGNPFRAYWSYSNWATQEVPEDLKDNDTLGFVTPQQNKVILQDPEGKLTIRIGKREESDQTQVVVDNGTVSIEVGDEDDKTTVVIDHGKVTINGGQNMGLVNLPSLQKALLAIQQDLIVAQSGTQITQWYAAEDGYAALEDKNVTH